ncbi:MAG TPA: nucleotide exchange factor GrpE [Lacipirellulaceae bacterium]|jgi:molecular chaperone GrpE
MAKQEQQADFDDAAGAAADDALGAAMADVGEPDLASELAAANDRALRLNAEMQNLRNRTSREIADERKYAVLPMLRDLLPVVDNVDRAIEAAEKAGEADKLLEGFRLVRQQLATVLSSHGCELIEAAGKPFDPHVHQAILHQPSADVAAGSITMVTQAGYKLHDRVVRPAQVIVSSGPPPG